MEHPIESMNRQVADQCDIARLIDHTSLKPEATYEAIRKTCEEARKYGFASVYVHPSMIACA